MGNGAQFESRLHSGAVAEHTGSSGTCCQDGTSAQGEPEPNPGSESLSSGKPMPRVKLGEMPARDQMDPELGSRPSSRHDKFYLQRIPGKRFVGFIFVVVLGFWGYVWGSIWLFF